MTHCRANVPCFCLLPYHSFSPLLSSRVPSHFEGRLVHKGDVSADDPAAHRVRRGEPPSIFSSFSFSLCFCRLSWPVVVIFVFYFAFFVFLWCETSFKWLWPSRHSTRLDSITMLVEYERCPLSSRFGCTFTLLFSSLLLSISISVCTFYFLAAS